MTAWAKEVCAWCGVLLSDGPLPITHGICDECAVKLICEHEWAEQPGEPPVDVCVRCGEVRQ